MNKTIAMIAAVFIAICGLTTTASAGMTGIAPVAAVKSALAADVIKVGGKHRGRRHGRRHGRHHFRHHRWRHRYAYVGPSCHWLWDRYRWTGKYYWKKRYHACKYGY